LAFARKHTWNAAEKGESHGQQRYRVIERRENRTEIVVTLMSELNPKAIAIDDASSSTCT
jgi:hypothetical protein